MNLCVCLKNGFVFVVLCLLIKCCCTINHFILKKSTETEHLIYFYILLFEANNRNLLVCNWWKLLGELINKTVRYYCTPDYVALRCISLRQCLELTRFVYFICWNTVTKQLKPLLLCPLRYDRVHNVMPRSTRLSVRLSIIYTSVIYISRAYATMSVSVCLWRNCIGSRCMPGT